jgi:hypothetical protein
MLKSQIQGNETKIKELKMKLKDIRVQIKLKK